MTIHSSTLSQFAAFIGLDWADGKHDLCLQPAGSDQLRIPLKMTGCSAGT